MTAGDARGLKRSIRDSFPERYVAVPKPSEAYLGETRVYSSWGTGGLDQTYHADRGCPHFPDAPLDVLPVSFAREAVYYEPCSHCTIEKPGVPGG